MDPDTVTPEWTYQDYEQKRSAKLDSLAEILLHHLARDGQLAIVPSQQVLTQPSAQQQQQQQQEPLQTGAQSNNLLPDKIVIYSYFPFVILSITLIIRDLSCSMIN